MKDLFLYFSAFIPMYVLILIKFIFEKINNRITFNITNTLIFIILVVMIILGIIGLIWNIRFNNEISEEVVILTQTNITDQHFFNYVSLFVLFALSFELTKVSMFIVSGVIIILLGIVYVNNKMFYINPLLNILGYSFYEITFYKTHDSSKQTHTAKMFFKGNLQTHKKYNLKLKNKNFAFVDKK